MLNYELVISWKRHPQTHANNFGLATIDWNWLCRHAAQKVASCE
jgi:hypothetical protein